MEPETRSFLQSLPDSLQGLDSGTFSLLFGDLSYLEAVYAPHLPPELAERAQAKLKEAREAAAGSRARRVDDIFSGAYAKRLGRDTKDVFLSPFHWDGGDWGKAAVALGGTAALFAADHPTRGFFQDHRSGALDRVTSAVEPLGRLSRESVLIVGGSYAVGKIFHHDPTLKFAGDALEGILLSQTSVHAIKLATGRSRPLEGRGNAHISPPGLTSSFPSGHTAQAFAIATAVAENTQNRWVEVATYSAASLVGVQRIYNDKHWLSDVALGAVIGHAVTRWAIKRNNPKDPGTPRRMEFSVGPDPVMGGVSGGVTVNLDRK